MANEKVPISALPAAPAVADTDQIPANQAGTTRRMTVAQLAAHIGPTGPAGGVLAGTYPNPGFAAPMATTAALNGEATARQNADAANLALLADYLLVDGFTWSNLDHPATFPPEAHASTHATAGSDPLTPQAIGAATTAALATETTNRQAVDSSLTAQIAALDTDIDTEAATRSAADTAEATIRANADSAEATTRATNDTTNATAITTEATARASADTAEATARTNADTTHAALTTTAHGGIVADTDGRLTNSRAPTGAAGGVLSGIYPNPAFAVDMATQAELDTETTARASADTAHAALTTTAHGGLVAPTDSRLSDARIPTAHASTHAGGGSDAIATATTSVSGLLSAADKTKLDSVASGATANVGTVTSVGLTLPGVIFDAAVTGSPVTGVGTLTPALKTQTANTVLAGPTTGAAATPTMRALVPADLPAATTGAAGSLSAADKTKLDGVASGATANVGTVTDVTGTAPIASTGGTAPVISIAAATTSAAGSLSAADKIKIDALGTASTQASTAFDAAGAATSAVATHAALVTGVHGLVNSGSFTLTIPQTGTAALLATSNLFTVRQDVRASGSGIAAGLYVPWVSGDTLPTLVIGSSNASNNQTAISATTYNGVGILAQTVGGGTAVQAVTTGVGSMPVLGQLTDSVTAAISNVIQLRHRSSGTPATGFGGGLLMQLKSATTNDQDAAQIAALWTDATHATRTSAVTISTVSSAGSLTERARFDAGSGAGSTGFMLFDLDSGTMKRVKVGAAGTGPGGSGQALYI